MLKELTPNKKIRNPEVQRDITTNHQDCDSSKTTLVSIPEVQIPDKSNNTLLLQQLIPDEKIKTEEVKINITTNQEDCNSTLELKNTGTLTK